MTGVRILFVEDEPGLARAVADRLVAEGYFVDVEASGESGLRAAMRGDFDLVLLDLMLPGIDGYEVCRELRRAGMRMPILMLTARGEVRDKVMGLRLGADDYLVKPFDPAELSARVAALLRRVPMPRDDVEVYRFGDVKVDVRAMTVSRAGVEIEMKFMEFQLLAHLVRNPGVVLSRDQILRDVWNFDRAPRTRTVDVHVTWLRAKVEPDRARPRYIRSVRGVGYRFEIAPADDSQPDL